MAGDLTFNKFAGAILATALGVMLIKEVSHSAIHPHVSENFAYMSDVPAPSDNVAPAEVELPFPQADWVDAMDAEKGEKYFKACAACHTVEAGGANVQGPNLWNIVGRPSGAIDGYAYSSGMAGKNVNWGYEELDAFLKRPSKYVPGTKMGYSGEKKDAKRAALIEYLRTLSDNPVPRPVAASAEAPADDMVVEAEMPEGMEDTTIVETVQDGVETVSEDANDVLDAVEGEAQDLMDKIEDGAEDAMDKVEDAVTSDE